MLASGLAGGRTASLTSHSRRRHASLMGSRGSGIVGVLTPGSRRVHRRSADRPAAERCRCPPRTVHKLDGDPTVDPRVGRRSRDRSRPGRPRRAPAPASETRPRRGRPRERAIRVGCPNAELVETGGTRRRQRERQAGQASAGDRRRRRPRPRSPAPCTPHGRPYPAPPSSPGRSSERSARPAAPRARRTPAPTPPARTPRPGRCRPRRGVGSGWECDEQLAHPGRARQPFLPPASTRTTGAFGVALVESDGWQGAPDLPGRPSVRAGSRPRGCSEHSGSGCSSGYG